MKIKLLNKLLLVLLLVFVFFAVPTAVNAAIWRDAVGLLPGTAVVFASDAPAVDRYMATALKVYYGNRLGVCDGTADNVQIQAAFDAAALIASATYHPLVKLVGTFTLSAQLEAVSNVDVSGGDLTLNVTVNDVYPVYFNAITNTKWTNVIIRATGTARTAAVMINGCDNTVEFENVRAINTTTFVGYGGQGFSIDESSPTLRNCYGQGSSTTTQGQGIHVIGTTATTSRPNLYDCVGVASGLTSAGIGVDIGVEANFYNCTGTSAGSANLTFGIVVYNASGGNFYNCTGIAGNGAGSYGITIREAACPTFYNCTAYGGLSTNGTGAWQILKSAAPKLVNCIGTPQTINRSVACEAGVSTTIVGEALASFYYTATIYVFTAHPGETISLGTAPGGTNIASSISIGTTGPTSVSLSRVFLAAAADTYLTASAALGVGDLYIYYSRIYALASQVAMNTNTAGKARIIGGHFIGYDTTYGAWYNEAATSYFTVDGAVIENLRTTERAIRSSVALVAFPASNCNIIGTLSNINYLSPKNSTITPGEIRTASGSLTAGVANAIAFAWHNPEVQDILTQKVTVEITTAGGTALSVIQVGIADDAAGTNLGSEFFTAIDANAAAVRDSYLAADTGAQTKFVFCEDSVAATNGWVVGQILTQNAASLVGKYYIEYVGR